MRKKEFSLLNIGLNIKIFILLLSFPSIHILAQKTIFYEDFGTPAGRTTATWAAVGQNAFAFADPSLVYPLPKPANYDKSDTEWQNRAKEIENNHYAVVTPAKIYTSVPGFTSAYKVWPNIEQYGRDALNKSNGGVMVVNAGNTPGVLYKRPVTLERGKYYKLTYQLWVEGGTVQLRTNMHDKTGIIGLGYNLSSNFQTKHAWQEVVQYFYLPKSDCTDQFYTISLQNHHLADSGNDFAVDEIKLTEVAAGSVPQMSPPAIILSPCMSDVKIPSTSDDNKLNQPSGNVSLDVLQNDKTGNNAQATKDNISFDFVVPQGASLFAEWGLNLLIIPGEGVWEYKNGQVTFHPGATGSYGNTQPTFSFTGNPTPIQYTISENYEYTGSDKPAGAAPVKVTSSPATITVTYQSNPIATRDEKQAPPGSIVKFNPLGNDKISNGSPATTSNASIVSFINPANGVVVPVTGGNASFLVAGQGTWSYSESGDNLSFTPIAGFTGTPSSISYTMKDKSNNMTASASISVVISAVPQILPPMNVIVTPTPAFCEGDGKLTFGSAKELPNTTYDLEFYKLPDLTLYRQVSSIEIESETFKYTEENFPQGSYRVKITRNYEGDKEAQFQDVVIENKFVPILADDIKTQTIMECEVSLKVTTTKGKPYKYELRDSETDGVVIAEQTSNELKPIPELKDAKYYKLLVTDSCGNVTTKDINIQIARGNVDASFMTGYNRQVVDCETFNYTQEIGNKYGNGTSYTFPAYMYPIQVNVKIIDEITSTEIFTLDYEVKSDKEIRKKIEGLKYALDKKFKHVVTTVDACGDTRVVTRSITPKKDFSLRSRDGDCGKYIDIYYYDWILSSNVKVEITKYPEGFNPVDYNSDFKNDGDGDDYSHTYESLPTNIYFGGKETSVPSGEYIIRIIDACGSVEKKITVSDRAPSMSSSQRQSCSDQEWMDIDYYYSNMSLEIARARILKAPQEFIDHYGPVPFDASGYIKKIGNDMHFIMSVPPGDYSFEFTNSCGKIQIIDRNITFKKESFTGDLSYQLRCGGFFNLKASNLKSSIYNESERPLYLQKWYPEKGEWGHPEKSTQTGPDLNDRTGMYVNSATYANGVEIRSAGDFRVLVVYKDLYGNLCYKNYTELGRISVPLESLRLENYYTAVCEGNTYSLILDAQGVGELIYEIIEKDNDPSFNINNGTNPVFSRLQTGNYKVRITDRACGDAIVVNVRVITNKLPIVKALELCEGESGRLYVSGASFLTVEWFKDGVSTGKTGHSYNISSYNPEIHKGIYEARLSYPNNPNWCVEEGKDRLSFELKPTIQNDAKAGTGMEITIPRKDVDGPVDLYQYLKGEYHLHGEWTDQQNTGVLIYNRWYAQYVTAGRYEFKYIVNGTCSNTDTATVIINLTPNNYWHGSIDEDWSKQGNWTANLVPEHKENIEFATDENNGPLSSGNGKGSAVKDLHLDRDRTVGDLINRSDKSLIIPTNKQLLIGGEVKDDPNKAGTIVVKSSPTEPTGTLIFTDPSKNLNVNATVEFYNKAYECATCGFYRKQWQYFGIPVQSADFPYLSPKVETVNQWIEPYPYNNKWQPAPYAPDQSLTSFRGYEMTNSINTQPTHVYRFSGVLNVGNTTIGVTRTPNVNYSGMNLIANSFTAAIPITSGAIDLGGTALQKETVYLFNMGTRDQWRKLNGGSKPGVAAGQYQAVPFNLAGQAGIPDRILSMHTFMLDVTTPGDITLHYDQLVKNELNESTIKPWKSAQLRSSSSELPHIVVDVISNESADRVWLFENQDATTGFDNGWDGYKIKEGELIQAYVQGSDQSDYQIATVPDMDGTTIGIRTEVMTNYSISLSVSPEVESRDLYLRDLFTGRNYPVVNDAEYVIAGANTSKSGRFKIVSGIMEDQIESALIDIYVRNNIIIVDNQTDEDCMATVYDLTGRLISRKKVSKNEIVEFTEMSSARAGVYIVKVTGETNLINKADRVLLK